MHNIWTIPKKDELFSSWLIRSSFDWGCDPLYFSSHVLPKYRIWTIDRDRGIPSKAVQQLKNQFNVPLEFIEKLFIKELVQSTTNRRLDKNNYWPWLIPYGIRNRSTLGAIQYCPECIKNSATNYIKRKWRMAWNTVCLKHNCFLHDSCPSCSMPIQVQQILLTDKAPINCVYCSFNLKNITPEKPSHNEIHIQSQLRSIIKKGQYSLWEETRDSHEVFSLLKIGTSFYRKNNNEIYNKGLLFEQLPLPIRSQLIRSAFNLTTLSSKNIKLFFNDTKKFQSLFFQSLKYGEPIFIDIFNDANKFNSREYSPRNKPKLSSKSNVELKLLKLIRRSKRRLRSDD